MKIYSNLLIFSVKTVQQNLSKCNKKPTGNIYYILTEFEEKNTTELAQLMEQMLLILTVKVIFKITLLFLSQIVFRFQTQPKKIKALNINLSLGCFILASAARQKHSLHIIDTKMNIAKLLLNSNPINILLYEMQVYILVTKTSLVLACVTRMFELTVSHLYVRWSVVNKS